MCLGDRLVFTCITNTGGVVWRVDNGQTEQISPSKQSGSIGSLMLSITYNTSGMITSTGTYESAMESMNGTEVACSGGFIFNTIIIINITGQN